MLIIKRVYNNLIAVLLTYFIYIYPYDVLNYFFFYENIFKISSFIVLIFLYALIIIFFKKDKKNPFVKFFIYEGMGIGFISFFITNFGLVIHEVFNVTSFKVGLFCSLTSIFLVILSLIQGRRIYFKKIIIYSDKIKKQINLVFLSDLHLGSNSKDHLKKVLAILKEKEYDLLLIG